MLVHFRKARGCRISNDKNSQSLSDGTRVAVQETFCNICKGVVDVTMFIIRCLIEENAGEDYILVARDNDQRQTCDRGNEFCFPLKARDFWSS